MIEQVEISNIAKETICVLDYFNPNFTAKIPERIINELERLAKNSNMIVKIDKNKKLKEQNILSCTKDLITLIYYSYIATEEEKKEMTKIWNKNEILYQEKIRKKYNPDNIFKKESIKKEKEFAMVEYKRNIFQKILDKIKSFF